MLFVPCGVRCRVFAGAACAVVAINEAWIFVGEYKKEILCSFCTADGALCGPRGTNSSAKTPAMAVTTSVRKRKGSLH